MMRNRSLGKQKIKIEKIEDSKNLNVTFSKRRAGLFKKAHELSIMGGAVVGLICFSPSGRAFTYGSPNLALVMDQCEHGGGATLTDSGATIELSAHLDQINNYLEAEKTKRITLEKQCEAVEMNHHYWWKADPNKLEMAELERLKAVMEGFKQRAVEQIGMVQAAQATTLTLWISGSTSGFGPKLKGPF